MNTLKDNQNQDASKKTQESNRKTCSELLANLVTVVPGTDKRYSYNCQNAIRNLSQLAELRIQVSQFRA